MIDAEILQSITILTRAKDENKKWRTILNDSIF